MHELHMQMYKHTCEVIPTIMSNSFNKHNYNQHKNYTRIYQELWFI